MKPMSLAAVVLTVGAHFSYLLYLPSGGFLALRWPRSIWLHVPMVLWGVGVVVFGLPCPLTEIERRARERAGMDPLPTSGFIGRYVDGVFYPTNRTGAAQTLALAAASASWIVLAAKQKRSNGSQTANSLTRVAAFPAAVISPRPKVGEPGGVHLYPWGRVEHRVEGHVVV